MAGTRNYTAAQASPLEQEMSSNRQGTGIFVGVAVMAIVALSTGCTLYGRLMTRSVDLSGANEVPAVVTAAAGTASIVVTGDHSVSGSILIAGMNATAAHIHLGARGRNGPIVIGLVKTSDTSFKVPDGAKFTAQQYAEYQAGHMYVNVHSAAHKSGEIRGQLAP